MPVVEVKLWDLARLVKEELSISTLSNLLTALKAEVEELSEDTVIYEASHDRPDLFSAEGLSRALSFVLGVRSPSKYAVSHSDIYLDVSNAPDYRPYAFIAIVRNVELDDESIRQLFQLQEKLHLTYCGDREFVSIGLYDLDKVKPPIRYVEVRNAEFRPLNESVTMTLDDILKKTEKGLKYAHLVKKNKYPLLRDSEGEVLSFPPIINCDVNKITEDTKNVLIDVTGTEPQLMAKVLNIITTSVAERGGRGGAVIESAKVLRRNGEVIDLAPKLEGSVIDLKLRNIESLVGIKLNFNEVRDMLPRMGYLIEKEDTDTLKVWVPPYRVDVIGEVDLIEDITIVYGYERLPAEVLPPTHFGGVSPIEYFSSIIRDLMMGLGFEEVVNFMLVNSELLADISPEAYVKLANPKMKTYSAVRNSMIPSLLLSVIENADLHQQLKIFEVGDVVKVTDDGAYVSQRYLGFAVYGDSVTLTDGLVTIKSLLTALGINYELRRGEHEVFIKGRTAKVVVSGSEVGILGEVHPEYLVKYRLVWPLVVGELNLSKLISEFK